MSQRKEDPPSTIFRPETAQTGGVGTPIAALITGMKVNFIATDDDL